METETLIGIMLLAAMLTFLVRNFAIFEEDTANSNRAIDTERVEVRAATVEAALDQLDRLSASVFPNARKGSLQLDRTDNAKLLGRVLKETSPLLPTTVAQVWISSQLVATVRIPNPNFAAA